VVRREKPLEINELDKDGNKVSFVTCVSLPNLTLDSWSHHYYIKRRSIERVRRHNDIIE